jgi:DNA-3-methyladenine glycosylase II
MDGDIRKGLKVLSEKDRVMAALIRRLGYSDFRISSTPYQSLIQGIIYQQLSSSAAKAVLHRFLALYGGTYPEPATLLETGDEKLRSTGISTKKVGYLKEVARFELTGTLRQDRLSRLTDEEVMEELDRIRGVGPWTVQMLQIFVLGRLDIFPSADLGIRRSIATNYGMGSPPTPSQAEQFSKRWRPYRTLASIYLWRSSDPTSWP